MARKPTTTDARPEDLPINGVQPDIYWQAPSVEQARAMPLSQALANARAEFDPIHRTKEGQIQNRKYKYADHADVLDAVIEVLAKYEIEVMHEIIYRITPIINDRGSVYDMMFMFLKVGLVKGADERSLEWPIGPIDAKNQTNGANLTYAKRYAISTILNLAPDDDTDGVSPDETETRGRNGDRGRDRDYRDDRSNFDRHDDRDPDAWRDDTRGRGRDERDDRRDSRGNGEDRSGNGSVRSEPVRRGPKNEVDRSYQVAIDSLRSAGNRRSCEVFWQTFKDSTKLPDNSREYDEVKELYKERWNHHKKLEDAQKDPLGASDEPKEKVPGPDVHPDEEHVSPDAAMDQVQKMLENCATIEEYDRLLKEHAHLFDAASSFPPDAELIQDMKEETVKRLEESDGRTQRMEDVEDRDRRENGDERF